MEVAYKLLPFFNMIENVYHVGGKYGETLSYSNQEIRFVSLKEFTTLS
jgi:hypothetical protein